MCAHLACATRTLKVVVRPRVKKPAAPASMTVKIVLWCGRWYRREQIWNGQIASEAILPPRNNGTRRANGNNVDVYAQVLGSQTIGLAVDPWELPGLAVMQPRPGRRRGASAAAVICAGSAAQVTRRVQVAQCNRT